MTLRCPVRHCRRLDQCFIPLACTERFKRFFVLYASAQFSDGYFWKFLWWFYWHL